MLLLYDSQLNSACQNCNLELKKKLGELFITRNRAPLLDRKDESKHGISA